MKKFLIPFVAVAALIFTGCASPKKIAYLQHAEDENYDATRYQHNIKVMPKDNLTILVTATDPEAVSIFNKHISRNQNQAGIGGNMYSYAVDDDGTINFPIVGRIKVEGLSRLEVEQLIGDKIKPYLAESENPIVTVRINSFHFTILGEVGSPGVKTSGREKCSLLDAIAMSGDINILGKRDNIMLIREAADGGKSVHRLNILDPNVMKSPYFYLQQNDVLYVEPNSIRKTNASIGTSTHLWFSLASVLVSSATLVVNVINKTK
ncbi:MAG: polysaccharide biosynthesis/export family protein [Prevotella sp.]|nr:polysaccharide biosynthesis/export family protein [Prevotella sp.]